MVLVVDLPLFHTDREDTLTQLYSIGKVRIASAMSTPSHGFESGDLRASQRRELPHGLCCIFGAERLQVFGLQIHLAYLNEKSDFDLVGRATIKS